MKRIDNILEDIADIDNLRLAYWKAKKGKGYSMNVSKFSQKLDDNLLLLRNQILSGVVDVGNHSFFRIFDPKERMICECAFHEQVLHHALMNICQERFERHQVFDSYACRKGKGTYAALERAKLFSLRYNFFLKLDIRKYFDSIDHEVLFNQLQRIIKDDRTMMIFQKIVRAYHSGIGRGLPIGSLTSQFLANHYLSGLDHLIKERFHIRAFVRYMNDFILWHNDKAYLKSVFFQIEEYANQRLKCLLKPPLLNYSSCGLPFLGYLVFPRKIRLSQRSKQRFIRKIQKIQQQYDSGDWDEGTCRRHALPLIAFTDHGDAKSFRRKILYEYQH
jgi:hypothetical protein